MRELKYVLEGLAPNGDWQALTEPTTETDANLCGSIYRTSHPDVKLRITTTRRRYEPSGDGWVEVK